MSPRPLGLATVAVLRAIDAGHAYGLDIVQASGHPCGTVYPTLGRLEKKLLIRGKWEAQRIADQEGRPRRRYYVLTDEGKNALEETLQHMQALSLPARSELAREES